MLLNKVFAKPLSDPLFCDAILIMSLFTKQ